MPRRLPGVLDGVGCPDTLLCCRGDMYVKRFLCGVEGVKEAGGRDEEDR